MNRNCINCGAVIEYGISKCPYCNTSYFDFTCIDFDGDNPVVLKLKINGMIFETLAIPTMGNVEISCDETYSYSRHGEKLSSVCTGCNVNTDIKFKSVKRFNSSTTYTITKEDEYNVNE